MGFFDLFRKKSDNISENTTIETPKWLPSLEVEPDTIKHDYLVIITLNNFNQLEIKFGDKLTEATKFVNIIQSNF